MLVVSGRPASQALLWWILGETDAAPAVRLQGPGASQPNLVCQRLGTSSDSHLARRAFVVAATGLRPDTSYVLEVSSGNEQTQTASRTLPPRLELNQPFTIAVGSCFNLPRDRGITAFYPPERHRDGGDDPIRLRALCGDQIYMDLSPNSADALIFEAPEPWERYRLQWDDPTFAAFLRKSPTLMLADDHEFWNDYPHSNAWLLWDERRPGGRLGTRMDRAFEVFQAALNLDPAVVATPGGPGLKALLEHQARSFEVDVDPLHLFFLDTRTARNRYDDAPPRFAHATWCERLVRWLHEPHGAHVLFLSQPMIEKRSSDFARFTHTMSDVNLPDYDGDFAALWNALVRAPADRLVVAGDIHWSRLYQAREASRAADIYEVTSSPLALIPGSPPDQGSADGKVIWRPVGRADWLQRYATNASATYTTLTFRVRGGGLQPDVEVHATAWGIPASRTQGAEPLCEDTFTLRGVV